MNATLEQSHVRMTISSRLNFSLEEKGNLLRVCTLLGQLGPRVYNLYPEDEIVPGQNMETGLYGVMGDPNRIKLALPLPFQAPYAMERMRESGPEKFIFQSLLQLTVFMLCHEVGHIYLPINDEKRRTRYESLSDLIALDLVRGLADGIVDPPTREK
jgi:hypothetical protein